MHIDSSSLIVTVNGVLWSTRCAANRNMISHSFSNREIKNQKSKMAFLFLFLSSPYQ